MKDRTRDAADLAAEKLVQVQPYESHDGTYWICFTNARTHPPISGEANLYDSLEDAEHDAEIYRRAIADTLRTFAAEELDRYLREAVVVIEPEPPLSKSREQKIRLWDKNLTNTHHHHDLLELLDHERAVNAVLRQQIAGLWREQGREQDYAKGKQAGLEEAALVAEGKVGNNPVGSRQIAEAIRERKS